MKHGFIGFGHLAQALYAGLKYNKTDSFAYTSKNNLHKEIRSMETLEKLVHFADVIWLCVKPQDLQEILDKLKGLDLKNKILVSPVAGKTTKHIEATLGKDVDIIRIMPNLAIAYKKSVTAFFCKKKSEKINQIKNSLKKLGELVEIPEPGFDPFTAIFGSGPAFLLTILKAFEEETLKLNVSLKIADSLIIKLVEGTCEYFKKNHKSQALDVLIQNIVSKGGTTEAGLKKFNENHGHNLLKKVIKAAELRSKEISRN